MNYCLRIVLFLTAFLPASPLVSAANYSWPSGTRVDTVSAYFDPQVKGYYIYRLQETVGFIAPESWYNADVPTDGSAGFVADCYPAGSKDTLPNLEQAFGWVSSTLNQYYAPVTIEKWKTLNVMPPKVKLKYPSGWNYRLDKYPIFQSKPLSENKLVLIKEEGANRSEIIQLIRSPNTGKLSLQQLMDQTAMLNKAINFSLHPATDTLIGGLSFTTLEHEFMGQMQLRHFWFANENELIYISCGLLKDERFRYPDVVRQILQSITW